MEDDTARKRVSTAEETVRKIHRKTRKKYSGEEKIHIVLEGLRGQQSVAELYRWEGISESLYYRWSKEFVEAGKERLMGNTKRQASSQVVNGLRRENEQLKQLVAELALKNRVLKKSVFGTGSEWEDRCATPSLRGCRSSDWWKNLSCPSHARTRSWMCQEASSTVGINAIRKQATMVWPIRSRRHANSGIASRSPFVTTSSR